MGWNDHVDIQRTECHECGQTDDWEYWDDIALVRYGGANRQLGTKLGHDDRGANRCPHCGSTDGHIVDPGEDDEFWNWGRSPEDED